MADFSRDQLQAMAGNAADKYNIPRDLFMALITQESGWNPRAVSSTGAQGLGQLMPGTAANLGVHDPFNAEQNLDGAARYFSQQLKTFGSEDNALAAYNAGPGAVQKYGGVPPYQETMDYVARIQHYLRPRYSGAGMGPTPAAPSAIPGLDTLISSAARTPQRTAQSAPIPGLDALVKTSAPTATPVAKPIPGLDTLVSAARPVSAPAAAKSIPGLDTLVSSLPSLGTPGNPRRSGGFPVTPTPEATAALSYPRHASTGGNAPLQTTLPMIEAEHQHLSQGAAPVEKATWGPIQRGLNIVNTPITIASTYYNNVTKQVAKQVATGDPAAGLHGALADIPAYVAAARETPWGKLLAQSLRGDTAAFPQPFKAIGEGAPDTGVGKLIAQHPVATTGLDFLVSFPILHGLGALQSEAVGGLSRGLAAGAEASGIAPAARGLLNKVPEPVRRFAGVDPIGNDVSELVNKSLAGWSQPMRDAAQLAEDSRVTSQKYLKAGANIATKSPITGQKVNKLEELVADYIHAGSSGAKYENAGATADFTTSDAYGPLAGSASTRAQQLQHVAADAATHGIDMADVQRIGDGYSRILDTLGQHMIDMGLMKPEAYQALKGQYLPRLYLMTKGNPGDVDQFLKFLDSNGMLTPEARAEAAQRGLVGRFQSPSGLRSFEQSRKLADFSQMNDTDLARAAVPEATPAALHGIEAQSRAAGLADAHAEIAKNPEWAVPADQAPLGWKQVESKGPLAGMAVHPAVAEVLQDATSPNRWRQAAVPLLGEKGANLAVNVQQGIRKAMLAKPSTMLNVAVGHYWFAASEAAQNGTRFGLPEYAAAMRDLRAAAKTGRSADPYLNEAMNKTDLLGTGGLLPKAAKRVSGGVGLETGAQNALGRVKKLGSGYLGLTHDALAGGKFGLYRQLRKAGKGIDEAARLTRRATINYSRVPRAIRFLDQGLIAPFLTFPFRAAPLAGRMALRRPDIFATASGHRFTYYLDQMADQMAISRGQQPQAASDRNSGKVSPLTFPVPGQMDAHGRQVYKTAPLAAPLLHHFGSGNDLTEPIARYASGASPWMIPAEIAHNVDLRSAANRPIVPEGLPPGSEGEVHNAIFRFLMSSILPPVGSAIQIADAAHGVTPYPAAGKKPQSVGSAVEQLFTGNRTGTAADLKSAAEEAPGQTVRGSARHLEMQQNIKAGGGEQYGQYAKDYLQQLLRQHRDPSFTPNQRYSEEARQMPDGKLQGEIKKAQARLQPIIYGQQYSGADREAVIRRMLDWNYTLLHEAEKRKMAAPYKKSAGAVLFPLAELKRTPP